MVILIDCVDIIRGIESNSIRYIKEADGIRLIRTTDVFVSIENIYIYSEVLSGGN